MSNHEFRISEERIRVLQKRGVLVAVAGFVFVDLLVIAMTGIGTPLSFWINQFLMLTVASAVILSIILSAPRQWGAVVARVRKDHVTYSTPMTDKEMALRDVAKVVRTQDKREHTLELKLTSRQGAVLKLGSFAKMDALCERILGSLPPEVDVSVVEGRANAAFVRGVMCSSLALAVLGVGVLLGRWYLSRYQLVLALLIFVMGLAGIIMPFALWKGGVKGPKAKREHLFWIAVALCCLVILAVVVWMHAQCPEMWTWSE